MKTATDIVTVTGSIIGSVASSLLDALTGVFGTVIKSVFKAIWAIEKKIWELVDKYKSLAVIKKSVKTFLEWRHAGTLGGLPEEKMGKFTEDFREICSNTPIFAAYIFGAMPWTGRLPTPGALFQFFYDTSTITRGDVLVSMLRQNEDIKKASAFVVREAPVQLSNNNEIYNNAFKFALEPASAAEEEAAARTFFGRFKAKLRR